MPVDRSRLPEQGKNPPFHFPAVERTTLASGLRVWSVRHVAIPVATVMLLVRRGASEDPAGKEGLAALTADMMDEGTGDLSAIAMHESLARIGAQLDSDIGPDATLFTLTVLSRFLRPGLSLLSDIVVRPTLREEDFARVRQLRLHRLVQLRDMPGAVADRAFMRLLYGSHPYGHTPLGTESSLSSLTVNDVRAHHAAYLRPSDATLVVAGDCNHADVVQMAEALFSDWTGSAPDRQPPLSPEPTKARLTVVPRPGASQSELRIGHVAVARSTPDYHPLVAANMVLGGQFTSRINMNLRADKGYTYGARSSFDFRRLPGPFSVQVSVQTAVTAAAIHEAMAEIHGLRGGRPVTEEELSLGVAALTRGYARNFETAEQLARAVTQLALYDLPEQYFDEFVPRMERVTVDDVTRVAVEHLDPARLSTLIVGDYFAVSRDLPRLNLGAASVLAADTF